MENINPNKPAHSRKKPAKDSPNQSTSHAIVFITVCTKDKIPWLANPVCHEILKIIWHDAKAWMVGRYVIMPDHIHLFAAPGESDINLDSWIKFWKRSFTKKYNNPSCRWQPGHWDRRLRSSENYQQKWEYVRNNPVRHNLVQNPEDWLYSGEIFILD
mgnify:CR=1 FL=1